MFEKEAEEKGVEYADKQKRTISIHEDSGYSWGQVEEGYENGFKDGAELGYNKANEWHYVNDGDFPTDVTEREHLVALKSEYGGFFYETDIWCNSLHCFASNNPTKVYAWKEIVPPKESK